MGGPTAPQMTSAQVALERWTGKVGKTNDS